MVGAPGSGKSTYAKGLYDGEPGRWIILELDKWREAMWGTRQGYFDVYRGPDIEIGLNARAMLSAVQEAAYVNALELGFNVVLSECHVTPSTFSHELTEATERGIEIEWKVFNPSLSVLWQRHVGRPAEHQPPWGVVEDLHHIINSPDAWWRQAKNVEIVG